MQFVDHALETTSTVNSNDRVLVLKPIEGKSTRDAKGLIDNRLFKGENKLHAKMNLMTNLWEMNYDTGAIPQSLKQQFTSFPKLLTFARKYFSDRNVDVVEVRNA